MKIRQIILSFTLILFLSGCDVGKSLSGAYNMTQCKYEYNSISALKISGMDLSKGLSLTTTPTLIALLTGKPSSVPLDFTVNLDVTNPNQSAALLNGLQYILSIDGVQFTTGSVNQSLNVPAGGKQMLPLSIGLDLATLLSGDSRDAVVNITKNFVGIGNQKSNISLQVKPTFMIGSYPVTSPVYVPINFSFGGMK